MSNYPMGYTEPQLWEDYLAAQDDSIKKYIAELESQLAAALKVIEDSKNGAEWISIEEQEPPKDGTKFLVLESSGDFAISHWFTCKHYEYEPVGDLFRRVEIESPGMWNSNYFDYWMPIPAAPVIKGEE